MSVDTGERPYNATCVNLGCGERYVCVLRWGTLVAHKLFLDNPLCSECGHYLEALEGGVVEHG